MFTILTIVLLLSLTVMAGRTWVRRRQTTRLDDQPGRSAHTALDVTRFDEMDAVIRGETCHCGGRIHVISEGSQTIDGQHLRVIRADCQDCEHEHYFFFKLRKVLH